MDVSTVQAAQDNKHCVLTPGVGADICCCSYCKTQGLLFIGAEGLTFCLYGQQEREAIAVIPCLRVGRAGVRGAMS